MQASWSDATNVLCVRLDGAGDVLMTTPALRALRDTKPGRRLTLLTSAAGAMAARQVAEIDDAIVFRAPWMKPDCGTAQTDFELAAEIAARSFDAAVIFTVYSQSPLPAAYFCRLAGIPLRLAHCRENPYHLLTNWVPEPEPQHKLRHEVRRQLDLVATVGCTPSHERLSFAVEPAARRRVSELLGEARIGRVRPLVVAHPGASAASRRYPPEQFASALDHLSDLSRCAIVLTGGATEIDLVERIAAMTRSRVLSLAGRLDLAQLGALLARADVVITNNTAPAHIAAAVGTPVVDLYALTNPQHAPWQVEHRVLFHDVPCRYCYQSTCPEAHNSCLRDVDPAAVASAALELLGATETGTSPSALPAAQIVTAGPP
jgi:lipopolysaccharide heptosyltransferase II